jgi:4-aminobutyrate aminotransferase
MLYVPADEVACIVIETIQGDGGLLEPVPGYFEALEKICREHGILIVSQTFLLRVLNILLLN